MIVNYVLDRMHAERRPNRHFVSGVHPQRRSILSVFFFRAPASLRGSSISSAIKGQIKIRPRCKVSVTNFISSMTFYPKFMTIVAHQVMNNLTCIFRYEIKDDTPIETKLEDKLIISETSTSLKASNKEEESADAAEQNRLNEKQAQGMFNNDILFIYCVLPNNCLYPFLLKLTINLCPFIFIGSKSPPHNSTTVNGDGHEFAPGILNDTTISTVSDISADITVDSVKDHTM